MLEKIQETATFLREKMHTSPETAIILGTGLGSLVHEITDKYEISYKDIPNSVSYTHLGDLMIIRDHINFFPEHPLHGKNIEYGPRFPDMSEAYSKDLIDKALEIAKEKGIKVQQGVYIGTQGPTFETPAEYKMFHILGADAVGMSTVPEVIVANHCGIKVFGVSVITDLGVEGKIVEVSHEEVQKAADEAQPRMTTIMREMINRI